MDVLRNPKEFGRRISAARGYAQLKKTEFAKLMGTSVPTVNRWEAGEVGSIGTAIVLREQLAQRTQAATGCPPEWLGLEEVAVPPNLQRDVDEVRDQLRRLAEILGKKPDLNTEALRRLRERIDATGPRPLETPDEGRHR